MDTLGNFHRELGNFHRELRRLVRSFPSLDDFDMPPADVFPLADFVSWAERIPPHTAAGHAAAFVVLVAQGGKRNGGPGDLGFSFDMLSAFRDPKLGGWDTTHRSAYHRFFHSPKFPPRDLAAEVSR